MLLSILCVVALASNAVHGVCTDGNKPDTRDSTCAKFLTCSGGVLYNQECLSGDVFYPGYGQCVSQYSYDCRCDLPSCVRPTCPSKDNENIPDPTGCNRFYYCTGGYPLRMYCGAGFIFDPQEKQCVDISTSTYVCPPPPFVCPDMKTKSYANPLDDTCTTYMSCKKGLPVKKTCDEGLVYYPEMDKCVLADSYDCKCKEPACSRPTCPSKKDKNIPDPTTCSRFYYCTGGYPLIRYCGEGEVYDPVATKCVDKKEYKCPLDPFECPDDKTKVYANPKDATCKTFMSCTDSVAVQTDCPEGQLFYPGPDKCVLEGSSICRDPNPFLCPEGDDKDYADAEDPSRFIFCSGGWPLRRECPPRKRFNPDPRVITCQ